MSVNMKVIGAGLVLLIGGQFLAVCGSFQVGVISAEADQPGVVATEIPGVEEIEATPEVVENATPESDGIEVRGWLGRMVGLLAGSQFDDYVELVPQVSGEFGLAGTNA